MQTEGLMEFRAAAVEAAKLAGAIQLESLGRVRHIEFKGRVDLVTEVDKRSEAAIVGLLAARFPDHRVHAEEGTGDDAGASPYRWLIDPLDGTTNYTHAFPYFGVSIALQHHGQVILGVVYNPVGVEFFAATRGQGATLNDAPLAVSGTTELVRGLLATGFPYDLSKRPVALAHWEAFSYAAQGTRRNGAAALDLCNVAAGRLDGFYEKHLGAWDCGAGSLIVEEAGGRVSDYTGGPFDPFRGEIVASNGHLHDAMLATIRQATPELRPED